MPRKGPAIAAILSGVLPGLGNVYVGFYRLAFLQILVFAGTITLLASNQWSELDPLLGVFLSFWWIYGIIDAHRRARLYNLFLARGESFPELPGDIELPRGGSLGGGILAVAAGLLLLAHTRFGMDLGWVADWWPLGLVGFGLWLIVESRRRDTTV